MAGFGGKLQPPATRQIGLNPLPQYSRQSLPPRAFFHCPQQIGRLRRLDQDQPLRLKSQFEHSGAIGLPNRQRGMAGPAPQHRPLAPPDQQRGESNADGVSRWGCDLMYARRQATPGQCAIDLEDADATNGLDRNSLAKSHKIGESMNLGAA